MAMPKRSSTPKGDVNQRAKAILDLITGESKPEPPPQRSPESQAAAILGRKGGLKGGKARAAKLSAKDRVRIAKKAAQSRWRKKSQS